MTGQPYFSYCLPFPRFLFLFSFSVPLLSLKLRRNPIRRMQFLRQQFEWPLNHPLAYPGPSFQYSTQQKKETLAVGQQQLVVKEDGSLYKYSSPDSSFFFLLLSCQSQPLFPLILILTSTSSSPSLPLSSSPTNNFPFDPIYYTSGVFVHINPSPTLRSIFLPLPSSLHTLRFLSRILFTLIFPPSTHSLLSPLNVITYNNGWNPR